jgi:CelD/BcsL family acetyltransferase involved in cellulose biosynthesis
VDVELVGSVDAARADWQRLAARGRSIFSTWEWAASWWSAYGDGHEPLVAVARRSASEDPFAVLPLFASRRPSRVVRLIGHSGGDQLGPVCAPADRPDAMTAMALALDLAGDWDLFVADRVDADQDWRAALGAARIRREPTPVLRFDRHFEVPNREHDLPGGASFRLADDPARLQDDMTALFRLQTKAFRGRREALHRDFAARALERGWLRLWFLEVDGAPVAASYGFRYGGAESLCQSGLDPAWEQSSAGFVLMAHTIRDALNSGVREYRLPVGDETYKGRFANDEDQVDTLARAATARGRVRLRRLVRR